MFIPGRPVGPAKLVFLICVSLMKNPGGCIAEHHTLEAVSRSQPLKHNGERALAPARRQTTRNLEYLEFTFFSIHLSDLVLNKHLKVCYCCTVQLDACGINCN